MSEFLTGAPLSGELLADCLRRDALRPEDALRYAIDIGGALSRAHARGEIHGAVSPFVIVISDAGAALAEPGDRDSELAAAYRAPEQVAGKAADWRSDVFSYGAVLYEMVNGDPAFTGTGAQLNDALLKSAPPPLIIRSPIHTAMQGVITDCLEKDPVRRRQRIQNAVIDLKLAGRSLPHIAKVRERFAAPHPASISSHVSDAPLEPSPQVGPVADRAFTPAISATAYQGADRGLRTRFWVVAIVVLLACAASVAAVVLLPRNSARVYRFSVAPEDSKYPGMPAISPDGRYLTWAATGPMGKRMLWVRALDAAHAKLIANTEGAGAPFWSPDSQFIGFFANQSLKKTRITDGNPDEAPQNICPVDTLAGGGTWNKDGTILFASGLSTGLSRVSSGGGKPQPVTALAEAKYERSHLWPQFLPDGKHFIFYVLTDMSETSGVYTGTLDSPEYRRVFSSETNAVYAAGPGTLTAKSGYLLYIRNDNLMGQPFSPSKLQTEGDTVTLAAGVSAVESYSLAQISVSNNGTLIYQSGGKPTRQLVWMDRSGKILSTLGEPGDWGPPRISPDGKYVAVGKADTTTKTPGLWILDSEGHASHFADTAQSGSVSPVWSQDGAKIAFANNQLGAFDLYIQPIAGQGKAELVDRSATPKTPEDWSHDGKWILFKDFQPGMNSGIFGLNMSDKKVSPIVDTIRAEACAALSPDGKWLAYQSDEQRTTEVYVQSFDNGSPGTKKMAAVSINGGGIPHWRHDGGELFYMTQPGRMYAVGFHAQGVEFTVDPPHELFLTRPLPKTWNLYDVSGDGQRFLMNVPMEWPTASEIKVTTSWVKAPGQ
jgi:Tol biopolymer transport system component